MPVMPRPGGDGVSIGGGVDLSQLGKGPREHTRASRAGELIPTREFPRVGIAGPPGTQVEVSHTPGYTHAVLTVLGGSNMAACGIVAKDLREHIRHCQQLLERMEPGA